MSMRRLLVLSLLVLTGCEYALHIPFPRIENANLRIKNVPVTPVVTIQPASPAMGETVTVTYSGLASGYDYSVYLTYGENGGWDPDKPDPRQGAAYYKLGNLVPRDQVASLSFDVRTMMGNDQNGAPFKLSRGQLLTLAIKGTPVDKSQGAFLTSQEGAAFLIQ